MLENVCIDKNGNGVWKYDAEFQRYARIQPNGKISGLIEGRFLPDPDYLWAERCKTYGIGPDSREGQIAKPQPATYALWEHWQKVSENA